MTEQKTEKKKKSPEVQLVMYTQQLDYLEHNNKKIYNNDPAKIVKNVYDALSLVTSKNNNGEEVRTFPIKWIAWNVHDSDVLSVWSDIKQEEILEHKATHIHMVIKFSKRVTFSDKMAEAINESLNNFTKPNKGRYAEENWLAYLVHAKSPSKHFYDKEDVGVLGSEHFDDKKNEVVKEGLPTQPDPEPGTGEAGSYVRYFNEHKDAWMKQRATVKVKEHKVGRDELIEKIFNFDITKDDVMMNDDYRSTYIGNSAAIDKAFEIRLYRKFKQLNQDFDNNKFDSTVIYAWGAPGNGKTTLARQLMKRFEGQTMYIASSSNPFDSYRGEDVVILDDVKANTLSPNEWLSLMDPTMFRELGSRYKNKPRGFKTLVITGVQRPEDFYRNLILANTHGDTDVFGPLVQFLRRLVMETKVEDFHYDVSLVASDPSMDGVVKLPLAEQVDVLKAAQVIGNVIDDRLDPEKEHLHFSEIAKQLEECGFLKNNVLNDIPLLGSDANPNLTRENLRKLADKFSFKLASDESEKK